MDLDFLPTLARHDWLYLVSVLDSNQHKIVPLYQ